MGKQLNEMTQEELVTEADAWNCVVCMPSEPGSPCVTEREAAARFRDEAMAWFYRRKIEGNSHD